MKAGKLRHVVEVQEVTESRNSFGEVTKTWETKYCPWSSVAPLQGRELEVARQINSQVDHSVVMRYQDITTKDRILFKGRTFEILSILNIDEIDRQLQLLCREVT